ncbi:hypothetical protein PHET_01705 [Paragonimus heterotremus]|uniref:Neuropeptide F n=1 Tax=Paragonimus heterotremus TaxID=100268 RepID=A0A8J4TLQ0_9TREM|nr:hypothetical protein PHET_01705 [Paragonimus heterotremus]
MISNFINSVATNITILLIITLFCVPPITGMTADGLPQQIEGLSPEEYQTRLRLLTDMLEKIKMRELNAYYQLHGRPRFGKRNSGRYPDAPDLQEWLDEEYARRL